jgi:hypothetical protein
MGNLTGYFLFPTGTIDRMNNGIDIQDAIKSGKPFRRKGWPDDGIYVVYVEHDMVLALETDPSRSIELDAQDILADDWYLRNDEESLASA